MVSLGRARTRTLGFEDKMGYPYRFRGGPIPAISGRNSRFNRDLSTLPGRWPIDPTLCEPPSKGRPLARAQAYPSFNPRITPVPASQADEVLNIVGLLNLGYTICTAMHCTAKLSRPILCEASQKRIWDKGQESAEPWHCLAGSPWDRGHRPAGAWAAHDRSLWMETSG